MCNQTKLAHLLGFAVCSQVDNCQSAGCPCQLRFGEFQPAGSAVSLVEDVLDPAPQSLLLRQCPLPVHQPVVPKGPRVLVGAHDRDLVT